MPVAAKLHWSPPGKRQQKRYKVQFGLTLREAGGNAIDVQVENMSRNGIALRSPRELPIGSRAWLGIPALGDYEIEIVRRDGEFYGCRLDRPLRFQAAERDDADDVIVRGNFSPRAEAFLQGVIPAEIEIDKWPLSVRSGLMIGVPLALWFAVLGIWFVAG